MARTISKTEIIAPGFGSKKVMTRVKRVAVTSAQILALHTAPLSLIPAPGAGKALLYHWMTHQFIYPASGGVQYTGGGAVTPVYHGATADLSGTGGVAAATIQAAVSDTKFLPAIAAADVTTNVGIDLEAATANFAAGNGTIVVELCYSIVTLG
jgi:hypothetical protein